MAAQFSPTRQSPGVPSLSTRLRSDVTWGRFLFPPPELNNPQVIFDPMPFRSHEFVPARAKKAIRLALIFKAQGGRRYPHRLTPWMRMLATTCFLFRPAGAAAG